MPRRTRLRLAGVPQHIIQRGNNRSACFYVDDDYRFYLDNLQELSEKNSVAIHAYVLMTNHVHLLVTPKEKDGVSCLMKFLGQRYVQYVNRTYRRSGTLWEGRFRSCLIDAENYLLLCQRYIELNPVRAGMVKHPAEYRWSSYQCNAQGRLDDRLTPHSVYQQLGVDIEKRCAAYRELFRNQLDPGLVHDIREITNGGYCLGNDRFRGEIEIMLGRRVVRGEPGRPRVEKKLC